MLHVYIHPAFTDHPISEKSENCMRFYEKLWQPSVLRIDVSQSCFLSLDVNNNNEVVSFRSFLATLVSLISLLPGISSPGGKKAYCTISLLPGISSPVGKSQVYRSVAPYFALIKSNIYIIDFKLFN